MPVPVVITDLALVAASNFPAGSDSPSSLDDTQRAHAGFIALLRDRIQPVALGGTGAITANAGADALGAFRRGTLLGTVSQAAGVPTGAVIERGSNANGEFVRFADGTQICTIVRVTAALAVTTLAGQVFYGDSGLITFAAAFIAAPTVALNALGAGGLSWCSLANITTTTCGSFTLAPTSRTEVTTHHMTAIGRWF